MKITPVLTVSIGLNLLLATIFFLALIFRSSPPDSYDAPVQAGLPKSQEAAATTQISPSILEETRPAMIAARANETQPVQPIDTTEGLPSSQMLEARSSSRVVPPSPSTPRTSSPAAYSSPRIEPSYLAYSGGETGGVPAVGSMVQSAAAPVAPGVLLPAALAAQSAQIPISTDQQVAEWEKLQNDFVQKIGGAAPVSSDPDSIAAWNAAQADLDDQFRAKFGWEAFLSQNIQAGRQGVGK